MALNSLRARLFIIWLLSLIASVAVGLLLLQLYRQSSAVQIARAEAELVRVCERLDDGYTYYTSGWTGPVPAAGDADLQRELDEVAAFARPRGMESGILHDPRAADGLLAAMAQQAIATGEPLLDRDDDTDRLLLTRLCPLPGPIPDLVGWARITVARAAGYADLSRGLAVLLTLMLALSAGLFVVARDWSRRIGRIIAALGTRDGHALPHLAPAGAAELDRIVDALNDAGARLAIAQRAAAAAEHMAGLGRVAAGVAHEIRNPIAAMRLRAESGLAGDDSRRRTALGAILGQIDRLDRLSAELLAMTARATPTLEDVAIDVFLSSVARDHEGQGAVIRVEAPAGTMRADPAMLRRALDNLVQNALRATPAEGEIQIMATRAPGRLRIDITDTGPGIDSGIRATLFEPFVTTRADGTGLGLAIAREMVQAHGGTLTLQSGAGGAHFTIELRQTGAVA